MASSIWALDGHGHEQPKKSDQNGAKTEQGSYAIM